ILILYCHIMKIKEFFSAHPVFRYEEFGLFMTSLGTTRPASWRQQLAYHQKAGNLIHIRKFLYAVRPMFGKEHWVDPYLVASKLSLDAVIAYHTALELHGIAYTTFNEMTVLAKKQILPFIYESQRYRSARFPSALIKNGNTQFGIEEMN